MLYEYLLLSQTLQSRLTSLEEILNLACESAEIPGVLLAANGPNNFSYNAAFGSRSSKEDRACQLLNTDSTFWVASCSKIVTAVAALQCVERGLLSLDGDITEILHEFKGIDILTGFEFDGVPILKRNTDAITLRQLLTHTSGISYDSFSPSLRKYRQYHGATISTCGSGKIPQTLSYPLVFTPGTSWEYGAGIDWVGQAIERVSKLSLENYMQKHVFAPLAMHSTSFRLRSRPDIQARLMDTSRREGLIHPIFGTSMSPDGKITPADNLSLPSHVFPATVHEGDDYGGSGLYSSAPDFAKLLHSLCVNDGALLPATLVHELFRPQLNAAARERLGVLRALPQVNASFGGAPPGSLVDWGLGGMVVVEEDPDVVMQGRRLRPGTLQGAGLPNVYWWMDPVAGVSGIWATQLLPQGDEKCLVLVGEFEREMWERSVGTEGVGWRKNL